MDRFTKKYETAPLAFNFDDLILLPGFSEVRPRNIDLSSNFSKGVKLNTPLCSSPMDTVTEAPMAIAMAEAGGIGVIHRNCTVEEQVAMARKVKETAPRNEGATLGKDKRLAVAAAIAPQDFERAVALAEYADVIMTDVAHFHTKINFDGMRKIINAIDKEVIIGSMGTKEGVLACVKELPEVAGLRCGIGGGSICTTTDVTKAGSPTPFAVAQAADALEELGRQDIPIIGDGGIRSPGDIALTFVFGASTAMMGFGFAGTDESPGEKVTIDGKDFKYYRGMGSKGAREKRLVVDRYADTGRKKMDEGVESYIPYKGGIPELVELTNSGLRASIGYSGCGSIKEMAQKARIARIWMKTQKAHLTLK